eukprot:CAMPEP_0201624518 /NCGR_PEP_ID=MMETSP0493-20130528/674_1 /ASSEMBLY_ACC=CAM_ASM_000838 /TAXON_ID=420259 /ORGANISM="Thalassiosira gravida, Strain GMp14c1" /LENGTH=570 /DNA_ID=CAMNT_0048094371 /DNA_START=36 /DNA_END=1748 /DNA_ORIENTATION=-
MPDIKGTSSPKKKIRIGVRHILIAVLLLALAILSLSMTHLMQEDVVVVVNERASMEVPPPPGGGGGGSHHNVEEINASGKIASMEQASTSNSAATNSFHFIVSSDCTSYQRWEVLTQLHSASAVHQCGRFTWIVSGCLEEGSEHTGKGKGGANSDILTPTLLLEEVERHFPHLTISDHKIANGMGRNASVARSGHYNDNDDDCSIILHPHVHFTPDYSNMSAFGGPFADGKRRRSFLNRKGKRMYGSYGNTYKFSNKPNGLHHWGVAFFEQDDRRDEAIVLIDPDFLFLKKFEFPENTPPVLPGKPAAAKYGLGGQFLDFNLTHICNMAPAIQPINDSLGSKACPFVNVTNNEVNNFYSAGPPYVIHVQDVIPFSKRWSELVPPTYDEYPLLYAEMFAYSMAAADLNLKHRLIRGLFTGCMTQWPHTDGKGEMEALKTSAKIYANSIGNTPEGTAADNSEGASSCFLPSLTLPPFLHYCSRYSFVTPYPPEIGGSIRGGKANYHFFAKRRVDHDILKCSSHNSDRFEPFRSEKVEKIEGGQKDWNVLAVCAVVRAINFAKKKGCETQMYK